MRSFVFVLKEEKDHHPPPPKKKGGGETKTKTNKTKTKRKKKTKTIFFNFFKMTNIGDRRETGRGQDTLVFVVVLVV